MAGVSAQTEITVLTAVFFSGAQDPLPLLFLLLTEFSSLQL